MTSLSPGRIALDATPLLGQRSGVGNYVRGLLDGLAGLDEGPELLLTLFSVRGAVPGPLPARTRPAPRRAPARLLRVLVGVAGLGLAAYLAVETYA